MKRIILILLVVLAGNAFAQKADYFNTNGIAVNGHDVVAYFKDSAPLKGDKQFAYSWQGTEWRFASKANLDTFKAQPEKYAPQFGGYCAYGLSNGYKAPTEPDAFTIVDNKLYLNYNTKVREEWKKDMGDRIKKGEANWVTLNAQLGQRTTQYNLEDGVAIQGYDPVAYFKQGKAVEGKKEITHKHEGVTYYFSSASNKEQFVKDPSAYEPQYGGWCAYAMGATGEKVEIDPATFKVMDGKLYLFYNSLFNNTLPKWNKDEVSLKPKADKNWGSINK